MEAATQEDIDQQLNEADGDKIAFSIQPHPITQELRFVISVKTASGERADVKMEIPEALNFGAQITAQVTALMALTNFAQMQAGLQNQMRP